jgi:hypothetical protein
MLNQLFFADPRGLWLGDVTHGPYNDYAPAVVTFNVSNNYEVRITDETGYKPCDIFGSVGRLEIKNITSHDLRTWFELPHRSQELTYSLAHNELYWQIVPFKLFVTNKLTSLVGGKDSGPVIIFHKKVPREMGVFDVANPHDRANFLLALAVLNPDKKTLDGAIEITATALPSRGGHRIEAQRTQSPGNSVISSLYRPRRALEIRWQLAAGLDLSKLAGMVDKAKTPITGSIRIVSPSRSLGTADQRPDLGDPIDSTDFPARITYAINYNIAVNKIGFVEDQAGIAIAVGALEVPPRDVTVAFDKPHVGKVLEQYLEFGPGHCTGMHEIPQDDFDAGVNFSRYWWNVPLDPSDPNWEHFEDYDPSVIY